MIRKFKTLILALLLTGTLLLMTCLFCSCNRHVHSPLFVEAVEATCEHNGNIAHWACDCGKLFADAEATQEISAESVIIARSSHDFSVYGWDDTVHYKKCSVCGFKNETSESEHLLKYSADDEGHHKYCYCGYTTEHVPHDSADGEGFCSECHFRRPRYELAPTGDYYIVSATSMPFKESVKEVVIPDTYLDLPVKEIGERAFTNCVLEKVTLGANVVTVGDYAFMDCKNLTEVNLNKNLVELRSHAFYNCSALETIELYDELRYIGNHAFSRCTALKSITIPKGVTAIRNHTFYECTSLTEVQLHDDIVSIETASFSESGIVGITLPSSLTSIPMTMFLKCPNLVSVTVPDSVTNIGNGSFEECPNLVSITIPVSVTSIGRLAFMGCPSLETVYYEGTEEQWNQIYKGDMWDRNSNFTVEFLNNTPD